MRSRRHGTAAAKAAPADVGYGNFLFPPHAERYTVTTSVDHILAAGKRMLANIRRKPSGIQVKQDRSAQHFLGIHGMFLFKGPHSDQKVFQQVLQFWFWSGVDRTKRSDANRRKWTRDGGAISESGALSTL